MVLVVLPPLMYSQNPNAYSIQVDIKDLLPQSAYHLEEDKSSVLDTPLITLFTTFKDIPSRRTVNTNTLRYWAKLRPQVQPVLYVEPGSSDYLTELAKAEGWLVYNAPRLRHGYPLLKDMFLHATYNVTPHTFFVGYANSDILFTRDLMETLVFLTKINGGFLKEKGLLMSGRRIITLVEDIKFEENGKYIDYSVMGNLETVYDADVAIDYFITTRNGYPWKVVPDFVIGKPGYDNWLLQKAVEWDLFSLDTSLTVSALHQTMTMGGSDKGWLSKDVCINRDLVDIGEEFPYSKGSTMCLKYFTQASKDRFYDHRVKDKEPVFHGDQVLLFQRNALTHTCHSSFSFRKMLMRLFSRRKGFCADIAREKTILSEKYNQMMSKS